jgi:8-oxo-dGTP diphosphatase
VIEYPRPALTVDAIVFAYCEGKVQILLINRKHEPFAGSWALPGGFVEPGETLLLAVQRELLEETGVKLDNLVQFRTFGDPGRDPRGWTVTVCYWTLLTEKPHAQAADDAAAANWFNINSLPVLAFDHQEVITQAINALQYQLQTITRAANFCDSSFSLATMALLAKNFEISTSIIS